MKLKPWLRYALITTVFWGLWGALIELPEKAGVSCHTRLQRMGIYYDHPFTHCFENYKLEAR